jgi:hypothetical protein
MLRGLGAGAAAVATAPALLTSTRAGAATAVTAGPPHAAATLAGLHGATLQLAAFPPRTTWPEAIADWDGYTGTTIKTAKVYFTPGEFPASISKQIQAYISGGIKALLAFKPAYDPPTKTDRAALGKTLQMYQGAGLTATVTLWPEAQDKMTAAQFHRVVQYYRPTIHTYYQLAYDAAGSRPAQWTRYYPGALLVDVVAIDYYGPTYLSGVTLDTVAGLADHGNPPKPFGIWEMGNSSHGDTLTQTQTENYFGYIQSFMAGRLQAGRANAEVVWFNGNSPNTISSSSDYRVPLWDSLVSATS